MLKYPMHCLRFIGLTALIFTLLPLATAFGQLDFPDITTEAPLSESELFATFEGQTHRGSYHFKRRDIETFSFEETTGSDNSIRHIQGGRVDTGEWFIEDIEICYHYDAEDLNPACFEIYQRGNCYYHYQKSARGIARSGFTARSVIKGEEPDCAPRIS